MRTIFPIGFSDINKDETTSFNPGVLWMTLRGFNALNNLNSLNIPNILFLLPTNGEAKQYF